MPLDPEDGRAYSQLPAPLDVQPTDRLSAFRPTESDPDSQNITLQVQRVVAYMAAQLGGGSGELNANIEAALFAAVSPSADNPFATIEDLADQLRRGPNLRPDLRKSAGWYDVTTPGYVAGRRTLRTLSTEDLCLDCKCRVSFGPDGIGVDYLLVYDNADVQEIPLLVYPDADFTGPKLPGKWVLADSPEAQQVNVRVITASPDPMFVEGEVGTFELAGVSGFYRKKANPGGVYGVPTGPEDANWKQEAPPVPQSSPYAALPWAVFFDLLQEAQLTPYLGKEVRVTQRVDGVALPDVSFRVTGPNTITTDDAYTIEETELGGVVQEAVTFDPYTGPSGTTAPRTIDTSNLAKLDQTNTFQLAQYFGSLAGAFSIADPEFFAVLATNGTNAYLTSTGLFWQNGEPNQASLTYDSATGTLTVTSGAGGFSVPAPVGPNSAATKQYVDAAVAGVAVPIASDAETQAGANNTKAVSPLRLASWWTYIKGIAQTIGGVWDFTAGLKLAGGPTLTAVVDTTSVSAAKRTNVIAAIDASLALTPTAGPAWVLDSATTVGGDTLTSADYRERKFRDVRTANTYVYECCLTLDASNNPITIWYRYRIQ